MYLGMAECHVPFWGHCDLDIDLQLNFKNHCDWSISHSIWDRNPNFGVCMHLGMVECFVPFTGNCDLDL